MTPRHAVVTLTGVSQPLDEDSVGELADLPIVEAHFRPFSDDENIIYIGAVKDGPISADNYGQHLDPDQTPANPSYLGFRVGPLSAGSFKLRDYAVFGTAGDKLTVLVLAW